MVQLSAEHTATVKAWLWEIYEYPDGFTVPAGWTDVSGVYRYASGATPPSFALPGADWGKFMFRLTIDNGDPGVSGLPASQFVDVSTAVEILSSSGVRDTAYLEGAQFDAQRPNAVGPLKADLRMLDVGLGGGFGSPVIANDSVTFAKMQNIGVGLIGNDTGTADPKLITLGSALAFVAGTLQVAAAGVTLAMMANLSASSLIGRTSAGSGAPQEITATGGVEFNGATIRRSALTGDITAAAGSNATSLATNVVNPTTHLTTVATARILGRVSASTGNWEILTGTQVTTLLDVATVSLKGLVPAPTSSSGRVLRDDLTWGTVSATATPGGSSGQLQWNSSSTLAGTANIVTNGTYLQFGTTTTTQALLNVGVGALSGGIAPILAGRNAADSGHANLVRWGAFADNQLTIGESTNVATVSLRAATSLEFLPSGASASTWTAFGLNVVTGATTGTVASAFQVTDAAHTALTASIERHAVYFNLAQTKQWATGALTNQRSARINAETIAFVGASTVTTAATLAISGPPIAGTNATITTALALWVESGGIGFGTGLPATGAVRGPHGWTALTSKNNAGTDLALLRWGTAATDQFIVGDALVGDTYHNLATGKKYVWQVNTTDELELTATELNLKSNGITNVATLTGNILNSEVDDGNSGTSKTIDFSNSGPAHKLTQTGNCTLTFTAPAQHKWVQIKFIQDGTGGRTLTFPGAVKWQGGAAPTWVTTAAAVNIATFWWDGVNYWGVGAVGMA